MNKFSEELLDSMQAGAFLHLHACTINSLAKKGELKSLKVGRKRLYMKSDLLRWLRKKNRAENK